MSVYLGIDIGTSGTKALLCTQDGKVLATATAEHPCHYPQPGWSEQEPEDWWRSTVRSVQQALAKAKTKPEEIKGIGLSGQMHGSVFLDKEHQVLRPALLWNDQRTAEECAEIESKAGGRAKLIQMVSNPAFTGFTAPKILWLRKHEPKKYELMKRVLLPKDYIRFRLTGTMATEVSDASGTLLLDVTHRSWCQPLLDLLDIDRSILPPCYESEEVTGKVSAIAAKELGIPKDIPVVGGGGDQAAGAVGNGIVKPGIISATLGTSGVVFAHADQPQTHPEGKVHTLCHAVRGAWHMMGVILAAGGSLQWFRNQFATQELAEAKRHGVDPYHLLMEMAEKVAPGAEGLYFLPYLTGERHPYSDPNARGAWIGLSPRHTRSHLTRAVIEGVTYAMRDCLTVIRDLGVSASEIRLSGGGSRSPFWRQLQADIYGQKATQINAQEGPAFGVALLAMVGTKAYSNVPEACEATIKVTETLTPSVDRMKTYDRLYPAYQRLYPALKEEFKRIGEIVKG
jgi:xylulokinase